MGMSNYGYTGLTLNMEKAQEVAGDELSLFNKLLEEEDFPTASDIHQGDCYPGLIDAMHKFEDKIFNELEVIIEYIYIWSEAEGTEYAGESIWFVEPEYLPKINNAVKEQITWSEYS